MVEGIPSSWALLGGFAIGYDDIVPNAKCQRVLILALCLVPTFVDAVLIIRPHHSVTSSQKLSEFSVL